MRIELEEVALVVPADAVPGPMPAQVEAIAISAGALFDVASTQDWSAAGTHLAALRAVWDAVAGQDLSRSPPWPANRPTDGDQQTPGRVLDPVGPTCGLFQVEVARGDPMLCPELSRVGSRGSRGRRP